MIEEGYHRQAGSCPDPECTQARVQLEKRTQADGAQKQEQSSIGSITDAELLLLVGEKQLGRLSWLRQKATAEADPTAAHCPRQGCQAIVVKNKADEGTAYETMRECHACGFCWCAWCNRTWHGRAPCQLSTSVALIEEYMSYEAGSEGATKMELRYGRSNLQRLVKEETERQANEAWLDSNAKKCPTCHMF
ncbi:Predicted E3 ubiquitin ligase [Ceraceosorus bombacis]|uniref:RBR-type E3 ubiquitin transferase n=1 Tax=Ceraceosorus bombacis TaxID=401625 RepID=A0A0P1BQH3_9BASI|nr:Predicted E3 ubiquitin ligase [Ceraceosorus bombacis]